MKRASCLLLVAACLMCAHPANAKRNLLEFHSNFWVNLHQTLYREAGRTMDAASRIRPLDTSAFSLEQRQIWDHAVHNYQDYFRNRFGPKDLVFDDELVRINAQLAIVADDGSSLPSGIPDQVLQALKM